MQRRLGISTWCFLSLIVLGSGCDSVNDNNSDGGTSGTKSDGGISNISDSQPPPNGLVTYLEANKSTEIELAADSEYLVLPYSTAEEKAEAIAFDIKLSGDQAKGDISSGSMRFNLSTPSKNNLSNLKVTNPELWQRWQKRLEVEAWTRSLMEKAAKSRLAPKPGKMDTLLAGNDCKLSSECDAAEVCQDGKCTDTVTLKVGLFANTDTMKVKVQKKGTIAAVLVDEDATLDTAKVSALLDSFEKIIYPRDVALFGDPLLKSDGQVKSSDRNADGLVWLVLTPKVSDKKSAVGFFNAIDFSETDADSNKADILYVDATEAQKQVPNGILAHEFQHLLNFAAKVYRAQVNGGTGTQEALWLDEGQAHFAEDACGFGGENVILLNQEVLPGFSENSLLQPMTADKELPMRGMAMTFVRYLFEQKGGVTYNSDGSISDKGGAAFLASLHTTEKVGTEAIKASYGDFKDAFAAWLTAIALDGRGVTDYSKYVFQDLIDDPANPGAKIGVKIRGTNKDDTGNEVKLEGPIEDDITADTTDGTIPNATGKFYLLKNKTGKVTISVNSQDNNFSFAVIKIK